MSLRILQMAIIREQDLVAARQIAAMFDMSGQVQTRVAPPCPNWRAMP